MNRSPVSLVFGSPGQVEEDRIVGEMIRTFFAFEGEKLDASTFRRLASLSGRAASRARQAGSDGKLVEKVARSLSVDGVPLASLGGSFL